MTYPQALQYLESFVNHEKILAYPYKDSFKLERVKGFLRLIGNPQDSLRCIHVAGSKGKGSTCAYITYILREAGFKVGLYTSPHLSDFRERIRILSHKVIRSQGHPSTSSFAKLRTPLRTGKLKDDFEGMITKRELAGLVRRFKPAVEKYNKNSPYGPLSFFEVCTALAFIYFREEKVDFAVLETGLGGRLDATNTVDPLVAVITPISYEHTDKLGNTLREIAGEKAGIIKGHKVTRSQGHKLIVVSAPQREEAAQVVRKRCRKVGAKLWEVGRDIKVTSDKSQVISKGKEYKNLKLSLIGKHQWENAACAIGAVEALRNHGIKVSAGAIRRGLEHTRWPGRCEVIIRKPFIVLDGAQNAASAQSLARAVKENFRYQKLILVLGISNDKDIAGICRALCPLADTIILTQANSPRATKPELIEDVIRAENREPKTEIRMTGNVSEAIKAAKGKAGAKDLILVTGSLFVVGEARELLVQAPSSLI